MPMQISISNAIGGGGGAQGAGGSSFPNTKSILMDGADDYVDANSVINTVKSNNEGTVSVWVNPNNLVSGMRFFCFFASSQTRQFLNMGYSTSQNIFVQMRSTPFSTSGFFLYTDTNHLSVGTWTHISLVQDGVSAKIYVNAVEVPQTFLVANNDQKWLNDMNNLDSLNLGRLKTQDTDQGYWNGNLDEFSYFDYALSATDISTIYNSGVPNNLNDLSTPPIIWYRCGDGDTAPTLTDHGSGGNNATMENFSTFSTDVPT